MLLVHAGRHLFGGHRIKVPSIIEVDARIFGFRLGHGLSHRFVLRIVFLVVFVLVVGILVVFVLVAILVPFLGLSRQGTKSGVRSQREGECAHRKESSASDHNTLL